jgi:hypothetical protein
MVQNLRASAWIDDVYIQGNDEHHWFWDFVPATQWDPRGYVFVVNAHPRNWRQNEGNLEYGGAVEVTRLFWIRKGEDIDPTHDAQLNVHVRNLGPQCFYSLWVAIIDPGP